MQIARQIIAALFFSVINIGDLSAYAFSALGNSFQIGSLPLCRWLRVITIFCNAAILLLEMTNPSIAVRQRWGCPCRRPFAAVE